jgi:hypothetical protein
MGTWSTGNFGNDTALDFIMEISTVDSLEKAFNIGDLGKTWIEFDQACEILAAAEIVAAILDRPSADLPDQVKRTLTAFGVVNSAFLSEVSNAIKQVQNNSELRDLWAESDEYLDWIDVTNNLLTRLDLNTGYTPAQPDPVETAELGAVCYLCEKDITTAEEVELTASSDDGILVSMTLYAHRDCLQNAFKPPHFNADGSPHVELLAQFKKSQNIDI